MGFLDRLFFRKENKKGELLIPCQNPSCGKVFKESEGIRYHQDMEASGLCNFRCPSCGEKFAGNRLKLEAMQNRLRKKFDG